MMKKVLLIFFVSFVLLIQFEALCQISNPVINAITVDTTDPGNMGAVRIFYESNTDPDIEKYILQYVFNGNFRDLNLSPDNTATEYLYTNAQANKRSEGIKLRAVLFSYPGRTFLSEPNYTVFLTAQEYSKCNKTVTIRWNNYIGWGNNIAGYDVYVKKANKPYVKRVTTRDTMYAEPNVAYETDYKFYVIAKSNSGAKSMSNIAAYSSETKETIDPSLFFIDGIKNNGNTVNIQFKVDNSIEVDGYNILLANSNIGNFNSIGFVENSDKSSYIFTHQNTNLASNNFYTIQVLNVCNEVLGETNVVQKINLVGNFNDNNVSLQWNSCFDENSETYDVLMSIDGSDFTVLNNQLSNTNTVVNLVAENSGGESEQFCFKVVSSLPMGYQGESNILCFTLKPEIEMANAFTPNGDGLNDFIAPKINNVNVQSYKFIIYDRYGGKVFESENEKEKWWGTKNNKPVKEGAYIYYLYFKSAKGKVYEKSGSINVVFP